MFKYDRNSFSVMEPCRHWFTERNLEIVKVGNHGNSLQLPTVAPLLIKDIERGAANVDVELRFQTNG